MLWHFKINSFYLTKSTNNVQFMQRNIIVYPIKPENISQFGTVIIRYVLIMFIKLPFL